jgi:hypothetical protein
MTVPTKTGDIVAGNSTDTGKTSELPDRYSPDWIAKMDGRTTLAKAVTDRLQALQVDLGGPSELSYQEKALCKRIVWLECLIETREAQLAKGEEIDEGKHTQSVNALVGLLKAVGLQRRAAHVPSLRQYLEARS